MPPSNTPAPTGNDPLKDRAMEQLQELIVTGDLSPGTKLSEAKLADQLGVSRATLREAMSRLCEIGLLVYTPYKGTFIRSLNRVDLEEMYSLRNSIEKMAFTICWDKRDRMALADLEMRNDALKTSIERQDPYRTIINEQNVHNWCYELSGHGLLQQTWIRLRMNLQFYFAVHHKASGRIGPLREAHDQYVKLASEPDLDTMLAHLDDHMQAGLEATLESLEIFSKLH